MKKKRLAILLTSSYRFSLNLQFNEQNGSRELYVDHGSAYGVRYLTYHRSNENSRFILPWVDHAGVLGSAMPFCSPSPHEVFKHHDSTVRLAHVLCRHAGYMIATK